MPHIERLDVDGNWKPIEGTLHNHDPKSKSRPAKKVHEMLIDYTDIVGVGQARETADQAGDICFRPKLLNKKINTSYDEPKIGPLVFY